MKTFFKVIFIGVIVIVLGFIGFTTYQFNTYKPQAITQKINSDNLKYFQESYKDCRDSFLAEADQIKAIYQNANISNLKYT